MASTTIEVVEKREAAAPPPAPRPPASARCVGVDLFLRLLLLSAAVVSLVVIVTSSETQLVLAGGFLPVSLDAKATDFPAFIYFIAALSAAVLYAIITILASLCLICRPVVSARLFLILSAFDAIMLGIVASATGAAAAVGYIALKGDSKVGWTQICDVYGKHCRYLGSSIAVALFASILLVILIILNVTSLYLRTP
ncbi:hypothetical protein Ancab_013529 [Ancistrocladus abbreviatus]